MRVCACDLRYCREVICNRYFLHKGRPTILRNITFVLIIVESRDDFFSFLSKIVCRCVACRLWPVFPSFPKHHALRPVSFPRSMHAVLAAVKRNQARRARLQLRRALVAVRAQPALRKLRREPSLLGSPIVVFPAGFRGGGGGGEVWQSPDNTAVAPGGAFACRPGRTVGMCNRLL